MKAIDLFNEWAHLGKDEGMERNHKESVDRMFGFIVNKLLNDFSFLDIGCGNGWVVERILSDYGHSCYEAVGIDGASEMIQKAKKRQNFLSTLKKPSYFKWDLNDLHSFDKKYDVIFSMEVLYYLKCPQTALNTIYNNILKEGGCFIMGIDHYKENIPSLRWPKELNVPMCTFSVSEWKNMFLNAGFSRYDCVHVGGEGLASGDWAGTLVLYGEK